MNTNKLVSAAQVGTACAGACAFLVVCLLAPREGDIDPALRNEEQAIATLKEISTAQLQCRTSAVIDENVNGRGEFGFFGELSGRDMVRGSPRSIRPPFLSAAFGEVTASRITRSGYLFQIWLPDSAGAGQAEDVDGGHVGRLIDAPLAEAMWCCYAWPRCPFSGKRAFFINQSGLVLATNDAIATYGGATSAPDWDAAFVADGSREISMSAATVANTLAQDGDSWIVTLARDGNTWVVVE